MERATQRDATPERSAQPRSGTDVTERAPDIIGAPNAHAPERHIERDSFAWNTTAGLLSGFQSVIMLMLIMRTCDVATAGIFTIAYTSACLLLTLGQYGMRQFQVSDRKPRFSFRDYGLSRILTTALMLLAGAAYLLVASNALHYAWEKSAVIFVMCLFKAIDSIEDVLHGNYQQYGRLDVGARFLTARLATTLVVFAGAIIACADLLPAMTATTIYTGAFFVWETWRIRRSYGLPRHGSSATDKTLRSAVRLLKACFPLFLGAFLLLYISNAPKYAIDAFMSDAAQAYYGFIAMPVFFVGLVASFVYNPMIAPLSNAWARRDTHGFLRGFGRISLIIVGIAIACTLLAWLAGVPVLNLIYDTDVMDYRNELTALVAGGAFYALTSLATLGIAIIRRQNLLIGGYITVALAALAASNYFVPIWGITGATWVYFFSMLALSVIFSVCFLVCVWREDKQP